MATARLAELFLRAQIACLSAELDILECKAARKRQMATVKLFGKTFSAKPLQALPDGSFLMTANVHTLRTVPGQPFVVAKNEVVEMAAAEMPPTDAPAQIEAPIGLATGLAEIEAGMAAERAALPSFAEITEKNRAAVTGKDGVSVAPNPISAPGRAPSRERIAVPHLAEKMKLLASGTSGFTAALEKKIDDALAAHAATQKEILAGVDDAFAQVDAVNDDAKAGLAAIKSELAQITNA